MLLQHTFLQFPGFGCIAFNWKGCPGLSKRSAIWPANLQQDARFLQLHPMFRQTTCSSHSLCIKLQEAEAAEDHLPHAQ